MTTERDRRPQELDYDAVVRTVGTIAPWKMSAILSLGATVADLEQAAAWISVETDGSGLRHEPAGAVAEARAIAIYDILTADRPETES
jgi:hypothetical protein